MGADTIYYLVMILCFINYFGFAPYCVDFLSNLKVNFKLLKLKFSIINHKKHLFAVVYASEWV